MKASGTARSASPQSASLVLVAALTFWGAWLGSLTAVRAQCGPTPAQEPPATTPAATPLPVDPPTVPETPAVPAEPATPAPLAAPAPPPPPPRLTFDVKFPTERGGGSASGSAGEVEYEQDGAVVARGGVEIRYQDTVIKADTVRLEQAVKTLVAEGNVSLVQGPRRLLGDRAVYDLDARTGTFDNATALVTDEYTFRGRTIAKTSENTYRIEDGTFTACEGDVPPWSFALSSADIEVEGYARVRHARMKVKQAPVLYFPYILWPAKTDRTAGLLIPNIGYSQSKGSYLGLAYYQPFGRSYDATVYTDVYSEQYYGLGGEFRYQPSNLTRGGIEAYAVRGAPIDPTTGEPIEDAEEDIRWRVRLDHETTSLPWGLRGVVQYRDFSDFDFFQDFDRDRNQVALRALYSNAFVAGSWGAHSFNLLLDSRETFIADDQVVTQRQLPEAEYRLRSIQLGSTPLYLKALASASLLELERADSYSGRYERIDLFPELSLPLRPASWLSLKITGGGRATYYGASTCRPAATADDVGPDVCVAGENLLTGEPLEREFATASAEIVGPSLSRVFASEERDRKVKHVIEPRWTYGYIGNFDDSALVPLFDEVDTLVPLNVARVSLVNRVLSKASDAAPAREIVSFELSQAVSFDDEQPFQRSSLSPLETSDRSPITAELRVSLSNRTNLRFDTAYSDFLGGFLSRSISGGLGIGKHNLGLTWFTRFNPERDELGLSTTVSDQVGVTASLALVPNRIRFDAQVNFDVETSEVQQQRYFVHWNGSCFGVRFEAREFRTSERSDLDYRVAVTLKSVGTFLDLSGGRREDF